MPTAEEMLEIMRKVAQKPEPVEARNGVTLRIETNSVGEITKAKVIPKAISENKTPNEQFDLLYKEMRRQTRILSQLKKVLLGEGLGPNHDSDIDDA